MCRAIVIVLVDVRRGVSPNVVKLRRHGFEESHIFRQGIAEAVEEILLRHQEIDTGDNCLWVCRSKIPDFPEIREEQDSFDSHVQTN
jgi:hypothetical protein